MRKNQSKPFVRTYFLPERDQAVHIVIAEDDLWLDADQISILFNISKKIVKKTIRKLFRRKFFGASNIKILPVQVAEEKHVNILHYNLNVIVHTGYTIESGITEHFRRWALMIRFFELRAFKSVIRNTDRNISQSSSVLPEVLEKTSGLIIPKDDKSLSALLERDLNRITYREAVIALRRIKRNYANNKLFGEERGSAFKSALNTIYQTAENRELYPSDEDKASHLLYFILRHQSFFDGNKRIGIFMFIWFLHRHKLLYHSDGSVRIATDQIIYLVEYINSSPSKPKWKVIRAIKQLISEGSMVSVR